MGVDRAIFYTLMSSGWTILAGPVNLACVVRFLSLVGQGYYYTFASILGLQIFFELGLGMVIFQFFAHEKARLQWTPEGTLEGDERAKARLASLLRRAARWYGGVAILFCAAILPAGVLFFSRQHGASSESIRWLVPWACLVIVAACTMMAVPFFVLIEGCGLIAEVVLLRIYQNVASSLLLWSVLALGGGLWATVIPGAVAAISGWAWLWRRKKALLLDLWRHPGGGASADWKVDWKREIWPLQWKIALSWLCSYFIFQLFNPVLFAFHGAAEAGRMGMSLTIATALWSAAMSWLNTKAAPFGNLVARRDFAALDRLFFPALWQSTALVLAGSAVLWSGVVALNHSAHPWSARLLGPLPMALLLLATLANHVVAAQGLYLRSHKQEPFLVLSLLNGALVGLSTYFLGRSHGATGMMAGYFAVSLCSVTLGTAIFRRKRRDWHSPDSQVLAQPAGAQAEPVALAELC